MKPRHLNPITHPSTTTEITMKKLASLLIAACAVCTASYAQDTAEPAARSALLPSHVGVHLGTAHSTSGYNNTNPGVYLRWADGTGSGPVLGGYYNSERAQSRYAGYHWDWRATTTGGLPVSAGVTVGAINGYARAKVMPLVVPSAAVHLGSAALRLTYVPKIEKGGAHALHLSVEMAF
jgi:Antimicrobial peptide resistance and lipid A acylation protein PagP